MPIVSQQTKTSLNGSHPQFAQLTPVSGQRGLHTICEQHAGVFIRPNSPPSIGVLRDHLTSTISAVSESLYISSQLRSHIPNKR